MTAIGEEPGKYWAFLSYSHHDEVWADWLHRRLERFALPRRLVGRETLHGVVPKRLYPVFRDREELPTSSDLGRAIKDALHASRTLIVICSPASASSAWVEEEVREFRRIGRAGMILCLIVDGEPNSGDPSRECFCPALRRREPTADASSPVGEPLAADVRRGRDSRTDALLKLAAGILALPYGELRDRERSRRSKRRILAAAAVAVLAVSTRLILHRLTMTETPARGPTDVMVMPFDVTAGHSTLLTASGAGSESLPEVLATHWTYWGEGGELLIDVFVCMGPESTIVVDPTDLSARIGFERAGPSVDLSGQRGAVVVTAYRRDEESTDDCRPTSDLVPVASALRGVAEIRNHEARNVLRAPAVQLPGGALPAAAAMERGLVFQTFNPEMLDVAELVLLGIQVGAGPSGFEREVGLLGNGLPRESRPTICCAVSYVGNNGERIGLPEVCVRTLRFVSFLPGPDSLIPQTVSMTSSGQLRLAECVTVIGGTRTPVGGGASLFGFASTS